jgi:hypothetical protein
MSMIEFNKQTRLSPEASITIRDNPENLTKEGIQYQLWNSNLGNNKYIKAMYQVMMRRCERIKPSKTIESEETIVRKDESGNQVQDKVKIRKIVLSYNDLDEPNHIVTPEVYEGIKKEAERYIAIKERKASKRAALSPRG